MGKVQMAFGAQEQQVATMIAQQGGRLFRVGGSVRDALMGRSSKDRDFVVVGLTADCFAASFIQARMTGKSFPVFRLFVDGSYAEFALARTERKIASGHRGFTIHAAPDVSIEEDLRRRDLTVNAVAVDVLTGDVVDPYGGRRDIEEGILRAVSAAFAEDPLRVYRTARFAAQFRFDIAPETIGLMQRLRDELAELSAERVAAELRRALLACTPSVFFRALRTTGALVVHFRELHALIDVPQPVLHHPEGDAFEHALQVLDASARLTTRVEVRFAALAHDIGKGLTPADRWPHHEGHDTVGLSALDALCQRLKLPSNWRAAGRFAVCHHMVLHELAQTPPDTLVDLLLAADRNPLGVDGFATIGLADARGRDDPAARNLAAEGLPELWRDVKSMVNGRSLNMALSGKEFGDQLRQMRVAALQNRLAAGGRAGPEFPGE